MTRRPIFAALIALVLASCSGADEQKAAGQSPQPRAGAEPAVPAPQPTLPAAPDGETRGGDGSAITLTPLSPPEIDAASLEGELACTFASDGAAPLLFAKGSVASADPAFGLIKIGDHVERVAAPGGFDAMAKGTTFSGPGTTIRIALTGPAMGGGESPSRPAALTFDRADGARRIFRGRWACGP